MAALPYIQLYVADYLADTAHLTLEEHGAYLLLIMQYWQTGKPLVDSDTRMSCICRTSKETWAMVRPTLEEFFAIENGLWVHHRIEKDLSMVNTNPRNKKLPDGDSLAGYRGYVYFVSGESTPGVIKIGYSKNPWARITELRRDYGKKLNVVATIKTVEKSEINIHVILSEYHSHDEWFMADKVILGIIKMINDGKITTVAEIVAATEKLRTAATPTTNTDTDTEADTDTDNKKKKDVGTLRMKPKPASKPVLTDEEWIAELKRNPAYVGMQVDFSYGKMIAWCEVNNKNPTRRRFINWLNREEKPMNADPDAIGRKKYSMTDEEREANRKHLESIGTPQRSF